MTNPIANLPNRGRTRNWADSLNIFEDSQIGGYQSMFDIQFLGGVLEQGLIGYITVVVNGSANYDTAWSVNQGVEKAKAAAAAGAASATTIVSEATAAASSGAASAAGAVRSATESVKEAVSSVAAKVTGKEEL